MIIKKVIELLSLNWNVSYARNLKFALDVMILKLERNFLLFLIFMNDEYFFVYYSFSIALKYLVLLKTYFQFIFMIPSLTYLLCLFFDSMIDHNLSETCLNSLNSFCIDYYKTNNISSHDTFHKNHFVVLISFITLIHHLCVYQIFVVFLSKLEWNKSKTIQKSKKNIVSTYGMKLRDF